jgi:hypothetical protein
MKGFHREMKNDYKKLNVEDMEEEGKDGNNESIILFSPS